MGKKRIDEVTNKVYEHLFQNSIEFANSLLNMYGHELPRFAIANMNQSEFIMHISMASFNAGIRATINYFRRLDHDFEQSNEA